MDLDSMKQLALDVRMLRRRGWITAEELARKLEELPDVADKAVAVAVAPPDSGD